jgi:Uma2 family endonuclease
MSTEARTEQKSLIIEDWWEPPMPPTDLIFDDSEAVASLRASGEPMESNRHRIAMNVLIRSINQAFANRNNFFAGGNMFVYYSSTQARNRDFKGPDFFVVLDVDGTRERQGWVVWEKMVVTLMSSWN